MGTKIELGEEARRLLSATSAEEGYPTADGRGYYPALSCGRRCSPNCSAFHGISREAIRLPAGVLAVVHREGSPAFVGTVRFVAEEER